MIIFLYGPDTYRSREKLRALKTRFINEVDKSGFNLVNLDGEKISAVEFNQAVATQSFLSNKRMVVVENLLTSGKKNSQEEILAILKNGNYLDAKDGANIVIFWEGGKPDKRLGLFKYLDNSKFKEDFSELVSSQLATWVRQQVKQKNAQMEEQAIEWLIGELGTDMWSINNELQKIISFAKDRLITRDDVDNLIQGKIDDNIFNLTDAVAAKNKGLALKLINAQLEAGTNQIYLFTMIVRQFRILIQIKDEIERGGGYVNNRELARELSLHPFVVQKAMGQVNSYTLDQLKNIYSQLVEIDLKLKSSNLSPQALLDLLVVNI